MHDTLAEARRVANNTTRQRVDVATRRAALAKLQSLDVVQVVDVEAEKTLAPVPLWQVLVGEDEARTYVLSDWRRGEEGLVLRECFFNADGVEVDGAGQPVPHGRVLVVPTLPAAEVAQLRRQLLTRWDAATREEFAESNARWLSSMSPRLRELLSGEQRQEEEDLALAEATPLDAGTVKSLREVVAALCARRVAEVRDSGLPGAEVDAALQAAARTGAALAEVPTTDREVAWMLAHLPPEVARRAWAMADALRERYVGGERLLPPPDGL